jgi:ATP-dependent helicase/nuclease subunit A
MTIHRAKGLEFDKVIVPGLGRRLRASPEPLLRWLELPRDPEGSDLLMAPITPTARRTPEPLNVYLKSLQARRSLHERARLLYVAATRARSELHLLGELRETDGSQLAAPPAGTLLATLWPAIAAEFPAAPQLSSGGGQAQVLHVPPLRRLPANWQPPEVASGPEAEAISVATYQPCDERDFLCTADVSRCVGIVVCEELRGLTRAGTLPSLSEWHSRRATLQNRFMHLGFSGEVLHTAVERAVEILSACAADPHCQWLFARTHAQISSPLELTGLHAGRIASVSIDRVFVDAHGIRWLIDFKPASLPDSNIASFLAAEMRRERSILERYLAFARHLGPEPARAGLYFPMLRIFQELRVD